MFEPLEFRKALGSFATGVTIVTACHEGEKFGVTANSFNSVSLDPPLVLWSLAKSSGSLPAFSGSPGFAVHILAADQQDLSNRFASRGNDKFRELRVGSGAHGAPLLEGCAARFECRTAYQYEGGDHVIFVGEVVNFTHSEKQPLLFHGGRYARTSSAEAAIEQREIEDDPHAYDLSSLVARTYFQMLMPVRDRAADAGLALAEHYALSILMLRGGSSLGEINDIIGYSGVSVTDASVTELVERGLITASDKTSQDPRLALTSAGRQIMIELIAAAKALEADALTRFDEQDARALKQLLWRLLKGLEAQGDDRVQRHMDLMKTVVYGET